MDYNKLHIWHDFSIYCIIILSHLHLYKLISVSKNPQKNFPTYSGYLDVNYHFSLMISVTKFRVLLVYKNTSSYPVGYRNLLLYSLLLKFSNAIHIHTNQHFVPVWRVKLLMRRTGGLRYYRIKKSKTSSCKKKKKFSPVWTRTASKINRWGHCIERDSIDVFRLSKTYSTCSCTDLIHFQIHRCYWESQAILRSSKYRSISKIKKFLTVKILESKTIMGLLQTFATVILRWMFQRFSKLWTDTEIFRVAPFFHFSPCIKWS